MPRALPIDFLMNGVLPFRYQQYNLADTGFSILGERASPAVPELARLVNDPTAPTLAMRAEWCLKHIGKPAQEALKASAVLTALDPFVPEAATNALERIEAKVK